MTANRSSAENAIHKDERQAEELHSDSHASCIKEIGPAQNVAQPSQNYRLSRMAHNRYSAVIAIEQEELNRL